MPACFSLVNVSDLLMFACGFEESERYPLAKCLRHVDVDYSLGKQSHTATRQAPCTMFHGNFKMKRRLPFVAAAAIDRVKNIIPQHWPVRMGVGS